MEVSADPADVESVTVRYLMYVLLPAWFIPGIADYVMHRRTRIERTSGLSESAIHALMMSEISVPLLLTLLCEVNPLLLGISTAAAGVHEATAIWDVRAAVDGGREVRPAEQHIHSFLESLPFMAMSALLCLHWDQVADAWQGRAASRAWQLRLRRKRLPTGYLAGVLAGVTGLIAAPPEMVLDKLIEVVRATGRIGVVGVYNLEFAERAGVTATVTGQKTIAHLPAKTKSALGWFLEFIQLPASPLPACVALLAAMTEDDVLTDDIAVACIDLNGSALR